MIPTSHPDVDPNAPDLWDVPFLTRQAERLELIVLNSREQLRHGETPDPAALREAQEAALETVEWTLKHSPADPDKDEPLARLNAVADELRELI